MKTRIKIGNYYTTRDGKVIVGPMRSNTNSDGDVNLDYPYRGVGNLILRPHSVKKGMNKTYIVTAFGKYYAKSRKKVDADLVRLATDEEIAKAYPDTNSKLKKKDVVNLAEPSHKEHNVQLNYEQKCALAGFLESPNGGKRFGPRLLVEAVCGGGVLIRTQPYSSEVEALPTIQPEAVQSWAKPEPLAVSIPAEEGFVVLAKWQVDYLKNLIQAISTPRIRARYLSHSKERAYEEALGRCAENADNMWGVLSDAEAMEPPSPEYGVETEHDRKAAAEAVKSSRMNRSLREAYYQANRENTKK